MTVVAIDFGTSNTVVCILEADTQIPRTLRFDSISRVFRASILDNDEVGVIPTLVFVKEGSEIVLGEVVRQQRLGLISPGRFFKAFKRELAADFQSVPRMIDGKFYSAELVAELFISEIWAEIKRKNINPTKVIFTAPVGAFERYLNWFRTLAKKLEIDDLQIIDESTAAGLGYAYEHLTSIVLVIDFGGGTLDLSLVRIKKLQPLDKVYQGEVIAKSDAYVGGEDIDIWIVEDYLRQQNKSKADVGEIAWQNLLEIAERLKIRLTKEDQVKDSWLDEESFSVNEMSLNREQLEAILEEQQLLELLRKTVDEVLMVAYQKGVAKNDIERVLLVGGTSQIPAIGQLLISYFGRNRVQFDKPFEAIAHGALKLAQINEVRDYLRHSYAIRLWEPNAQMFHYYILFEKGQVFPCSITENLTLKPSHQGQKEIRLDIGELADISYAQVIYDDEGKIKSNCILSQRQFRSLEVDHNSVCIAHLDPPGDLKHNRIEVFFEVDGERKLMATVKDLLTNQVLVNREAIAQLI